MMEESVSFNSERFEADPELSIRKPSLLVRLHHALSGVRGTGTNHAPRPAIANPNQQDASTESSSRDGERSDRVAFQHALSQLSKATPLEKRIEVLEELSGLIIRYISSVIVFGLRDSLEAFTVT